jgi:hypothetical protein
MDFPLNIMLFYLTLIILETNPNPFECYTFQNNMDKQAKQKVIVVLQNV